MTKLIKLSCLGIAATALIAASNPLITPGNQKAYCRGEVAGLLNTRPTNLKTGRLLRAKNGTTSVKVAADLGTQGMKPFLCRYSRAGRFLGAMSLTNEGKM